MEKGQQRKKKPQRKAIDRSSRPFEERGSPADKQFYPGKAGGDYRTK